MFLDELRSLLYPPTCVSCGKGTSEICSRCESALTPCIDRRYIEGKPLYSALHYTDISAHLILAAKESNDRAAARYLAELMAMRFSRLHRECGFSHYTIVPVPSSKAADYRRGYAHMDLLAKLFAREISRQYPITCTVYSALSPQRSIADQSRLTARERAENIHGAFAFKRVPQKLREDSGIVVVDDLVTTGSTMREAMRALKAGSIEPVAMLSACLAGRFLTNKIGA
jgi:ComF family protein